MNYSYSSERSFRACQRKWWLAYREHWEKIEVSDALYFGTAWHELHEGHAPVLDDPFQQAHLMALWGGYIPHTKLEIIEREIHFELPLARDLNLTGRIDGIGRDADGGIWVIENKTTSRDISPGSDYWQSLMFDAQISTYLLGARAHKFDALGVVYDVAAKTSLRPLKATPEEARKYTKDGNLYKAQRLRDESPEEYGVRIAEDIAQGPGKYYACKTLMRTERELAEHWERMRAYARQMAAAYSIDDAPQNPDSCFTMGRCEFLDVCLSGMSPAEFPQIYKRRDGHE